MKNKCVHPYLERQWRGRYAGQFQSFVAFFRALEIVGACRVA